jgi:hypothetical protein
MDGIHHQRIYVVGNSFCVEADDGQKVFEQISLPLNAGKKIVLSFQNVEMRIRFLNTALGSYTANSPKPTARGSFVFRGGADLRPAQRVVKPRTFYKIRSS